MKKFDTENLCNQELINAAHDLAVDLESGEIDKLPWGVREQVSAMMAVTDELSSRVALLAKADRVIRLAESLRIEVDSIAMPRATDTTKLRRIASELDEATREWRTHAAQVNRRVGG